jgi:hypothetical protein
MLPPLKNAYLKEKINLLKQEVLDGKDIAKASAVTPLKDPLSLDNQIAAWLRGLNPDQLSRRYGIDDVIKLASLKGIYKDLPARQMVASALYRCGFEQVRLWGKPFRQRRYWALKKIPVL